jgi:predicted P-loop ATPase
MVARIMAQKAKANKAEAVEDDAEFKVVPPRNMRGLTTYSQRVRAREEQKAMPTKALPSMQELAGRGFEIDMKPPFRAAKTLANAQKAVTEIGFICSYNAFTERFHIETREGVKELSDQFIIMVRQQVLREYGFDPRKDHIRDAIESLCLERRFNPVVDWLDGLEWDGVSRLDDWLSRHLGAAPSPLNAAIGRKVLCGMVRRAKQPGCKFDHVLVLEGEEGIGKSSAVKLLAGGPGDGYFSDASILEASDKEQQELTKGVWCYEISELTGIRKAAVEKVKQFISRRTDRARAAYAHYVVDQPRQCVFIGSTNDQEYLTSQTGNRRWWPVACASEPIDLDALEAERDQLFAEAVLAEPEEDLFIAADLFLDLRELHESRRTKHPWEDELAGLEDNQHVSRYEVPGGVELRIHTRQIFDVVLRKPPGTAGDADNKRLSQIMQRFGWTKSQKTFRVKKRSPAMGYTKLIPLLDADRG